MSEDAVRQDWRNQNIDTFLSTRSYNSTLDLPTSSFEWPWKVLSSFEQDFLLPLLKQKYGATNVIIKNTDMIGLHYLRYII
jgi:hypothetical protein